MNDSNRKTDAVQVKADGLMCDAEGCGWHDPDIAVQNFAAYVGFPCPDCGASVLTPEDYEALKTVLTLVQEVERLMSLMPSDALLGIMPDDFDPTERASVKIKVKDGEAVCGPLKRELH